MPKNCEAFSAMLIKYLKTWAVAFTVDHHNPRSTIVAGHFRSIHLQTQRKKEVGSQGSPFKRLVVLLLQQRTTMSFGSSLSRVDTRIFILIFVIIVIYLIWCDVALYYKLQSEPSLLLVTQNYAKVNQGPILAQPNQSAFCNPFNPIR